MNIKCAWNFGWFGLVVWAIFVK